MADGRMTTGGLLSFFAGLMLLRMPLNIIMGSLPRVIEGAESLEAVMAFLWNESIAEPRLEFRVKFKRHSTGDAAVNANAVGAAFAEALRTRRKARRAAAKAVAI